MIEIKRYTHDMQDEWDKFVPTAKNSTFLHMRRYMDYHGDRFPDYSLVALKGDKVAGLLPACRENETVYSHRGLTYGGWLVRAAHFTMLDMLAIWDSMTDFLREDGVKTLVYKPVPHIYHTYPAEEDLYAVFRHGGRLVESNISTVVRQDKKLGFDQNSRRGMKNAASNGITVGESGDFDAFWEILSALLLARYGTSPVHTVDEIKLLHGRFPENIRLYVAKNGCRVIAGVVVFVTSMVAHVQYIASSPEGREMKALPLVFDYLINEVFSGLPYFDFGTSNERHGWYLNEGLIMQKCGMGGRGIVYNTYQLEL